MGQLVMLKIFHFQNHIEWNMVIKYPHLLNFNELIKKHETLQDTTFQGLPKNVIPIIFITKKIAIWISIKKSNVLKTFNKIFIINYHLL